MVFAVHTCHFVLFLPIRIVRLVCNEFIKLEKFQPKAHFMLEIIQVDFYHKLEKTIQSMPNIIPS